MKRFYVYWRISFECYILEIKKFMNHKKEPLMNQCHLDKDDAKNSVCRNMYPVLFLYNFIKHLTG